MFALGEPRLDAALRGGLAPAAVHEVLADPAHPATAAGFALALAIRSCETGLHAGARPHAEAAMRAMTDRSPIIAAPSRKSGGQHIAWVRQEAAAIEAGGVYAPGLAAFGFDPAHLLLVHLRTPVDVMRAALEATRCAAIGAVILETTDRGSRIDLTATRRLKLAAEKGGVTVILLRASGETVAGAVETRWRVAPAPTAPASMDADAQPPPRLQQQLASERPRFDITLVRHRAGIPEMRWHVEWDRDQRAFTAAAPLSQPVVSSSPRRPLAA